MNSTLFEASSWDTSLAPLNLSGETSYISDRITLTGSGQGNPYLDFTANAISQDIKVNFPSTDAWYTLDAGFFSLYGAEEHVNYVSVNGSEISLNTTLPLAYKQDAISSPFYGLHIGSASTAVPVPGSLVLGGYDKSRCLTSPIVSDSDSFVLTNIGLGVAAGGSPFPEDQYLPVSSLLRHSGSEVVKARPNPGVPYLHLPPETCTAIAQHLPMSFNDALGLYIWNTSAPSFETIMTTPSYLSFDFKTDTGSSSIHLPFALLNLTLEWPLVDAPTQYFPCSPYEPTEGGYHLGRAFLQGAFLAQNWKTGALMLAQAPGPDVMAPSLVTISPNDTSVSPMINAPSWDATWSSKLKALDGDASSTGKGGHAGANDSVTLSSGAIAGIVIGVLAVLLIAAGPGWAWIVRRRKMSSPDWEEKTDTLEHGKAVEIGHSAPPAPSEVWAPGKHGLTQSPVEMDAAGVSELYGSTTRSKRETS